MVSSLAPAPSPTTRMTFLGLEESIALTIERELSLAPQPPAITVPADAANAMRTTERTTVRCLVSIGLLRLGRWDGAPGGAKRV